VLSTNELKRFKLSSVRLDSAAALNSFLTSIGAELVYVGLPGRGAEKIVNDFIFKKHLRVKCVLHDGKAVYLTGPDSSARDLASRAVSICLKRGVL